MQDHQALKTIRIEIKSIKDRIILRTKIQLPENHKTLQHAQEALRGVMQGFCERKGAEAQADRSS